MSRTKKNSSVTAVIRTFFSMVVQRPIIMLPTVIVFLSDCIALTLIYLAPRYPLNTVLAPPIRKFWGEQYLHYPQNFVLIPKLFTYAHTCIAFTVGIITTAIFIKMYALYAEKQGVVKERVAVPAMFTAVKKYIPMVIFFAFFYMLTVFLFKFSGALVGGLPVPSGVSKTMIYISMNLIISIVLQFIVSFIFPCMVVDGLSVFRALGENLRLIRRYCITLMCLVSIPSAGYILLAINKFYTPRLMYLYEPEIVLLMIGIGVIITTTIDFFITGFTTALYVKQKTE